MSPYKTPCFDCDGDVTPRTRFRRRARMGRFEIYMVTDEVWAAAGGPVEPAISFCVLVRSTAQSATGRWT